MRKITILTLVMLLASLLAYSDQSAKKVAIVKIKKGMAEAISPDGTKAEIKIGMWLKEGAIVKTGEKSFVKLSFIDKSSMNVGPKSELKIEKFSKDDAGVINVLTGKIRSQVTKDYLNMDKDKSKLFVKSKSAVMGIRGTDFMFSTNKKTGATTAVLFEGAVVFSKLNKGDNLRDLEKIVNKGRKIEPGQFSVTMPGKTKPTVPAKMSTKQFNGLANNAEFKEVQADKVQAQTKKSIVPPGLSGDVVMGGSENLQQELKKVIQVDVNAPGKDISKEEQEKIKEESKGFVAGDDIKPADGTPVDIDSGTIIPLGADSTFDPNAGEWVSNSVGVIDSATGEYLPPEGFQITEDGKMLKTDESTGAVELVVLEVKPVDEVKPLEEAMTVEYKEPDPELVKETTIPGENNDNLVDEFEAAFNGEEVKEEPQPIDPVMQEPVRDVAGEGSTTSTSDCADCRADTPSDVDMGTQIQQQTGPISNTSQTQTQSRTTSNVNVNVTRQPAP